MIWLLTNFSLFFFSLFAEELQLNKQYMQYIGIDMSKDTFHAAFDESTVTIFSNTKVGIKQFIKLLPKDSTIGVEATGVYHLLFARTCTEAGFSVMIINPLITHRAIQSSLRRVKTDKHDALAIRAVLSMGAGYLFTETPELIALKALIQERESLVRMRAETKQMVHAHKAKELAAGLKLSNPYISVQKAFTKEIDALTEHMAKFEQTTQALLQSIPGVGPVTAAACAAYIGSIERFSSPEKLTAYVGLDCRVHQSGTSIHGKGFITKRGNTYLRTILFNAAFISRQYIPELESFFEKKLSEGKHYFSASVAVERKLVHLIYAVWKRGTPYQARAIA